MSELAIALSAFAPMFHRDIDEVRARRQLHIDGAETHPSNSAPQCDRSVPA